MSSDSPPFKLVGAEHAPKGVGERLVVLHRPEEVERLHTREEDIVLKP
jgi:hypothetical protein